jgi:hypothetical protein
MKAWAVKKILTLFPHVKTGGHPSSLVSLLLLLGVFLLLPLSADDCAERADPLPDEFLDLLGVIKTPVKNMDISFLLLFLKFNPGLESPNHPHPLEIVLMITSLVIPSTVIRI